MSDSNNSLRSFCFFREFYLGEDVRLRILLTLMEVTVILNRPGWKDFPMEAETFFRFSRCLKKGCLKQTDIIICVENDSEKYIDGGICSVTGFKKINKDVYSFYKRTTASSSSAAAAAAAVLLQQNDDDHCQGGGQRGTQLGRGDNEEERHQQEEEEDNEHRSSRENEEDHHQTFDLSAGCLNWLVLNGDNVCDHVFRLTSQSRVIVNCSCLVGRLLFNDEERRSKSSSLFVNIDDLNNKYMRVYPAEMPTGTVSLKSILRLVVEDVKTNRVHIC